ncbi:GntR family transcriptional regulator [Hydromonas duriensis]|uniref:GntR family transcriptional regulator n=1 Tax=Hydromonas duriensis TaxID=1527608 RepID=A0A4V3DJX5_9BURK|nr:GntR family transcriptional regulator [Hydromonas duriensis]TDR31820.1 GntR family transcriptional regulator [Hydromonas duriensis]
MAEQNLGAVDTSPVFSPLYQQIKALLLHSLEQGEWNAGEMIPSEIELAARYKVSQGTVRKAVDELAAENLLVRRQGRGTFVATHQEAKVRFRFLSMNADSGEEVKTNSNIVSVERITPPEDVRMNLGLTKKDLAVKITRLLSFNNKPAVFEQIWLSPHIFNNVTQEQMMNYKGTLYGWFEAEYNVRMIRAVEKLRAVMGDAQVTESLEVSADEPLLFIERLSYSYADKLVEVRHGWYLTTAYHYKNELI